MGRRELAALVHSWATLEWEMGGDVNATRALFAKAVALDAQVRRRTSDFKYFSTTNLRFLALWYHSFRRARALFAKRQLRL
jgi:hypothetical protein